MSYWEDVPLHKICNHPEHNPPMGLYVPQGKVYVHICPACKFEIRFSSTIISINNLPDITGKKND